MEQHSSIPAYSETKVGIRLIGFGAIGKAVYQAIESRQITSGFHVSKILIRDGLKPRFIDQPDGQSAVVAGELFTDSLDEFLPPAGRREIVIDASDAVEPDALNRALDIRHAVISANKRLLATHGREFVDIARQRETFILHEAAALAKAPVFRNLAGYHRTLGVSSLAAISNGTANYVLSKVAAEGITLSEALTAAKELGYAEPDPTMDIDGFDSFYKNKLLAAAAFGLPDLLSKEIDGRLYRAGIRDLDPEIFRFARHTGATVKLIASASSEADSVALKVIPTLVPRDSFLGATNGVTNGIVIADGIGPDNELGGPGAGSEATVAAILADVQLARDAIVSGVMPQEFASLAQVNGHRIAEQSEVCIRPLFQSYSPQHEAGVIARKSEALANAGIVIEQFHNGTVEDSEQCTVDFFVGESTDLATAQRAVNALEQLSCVKGRVTLLDVITTGSTPLTLS